MDVPTDQWIQFSVPRSRNVILVHPGIIEEGKKHPVCRKKPGVPKRHNRTATMIHAYQNKSHGKKSNNPKVNMKLSFDINIEMPIVNDLKDNSLSNQDNTMISYKEIDIFEENADEIYFGDVFDDIHDIENIEQSMDKIYDFFGELYQLK